MCAMDLLLNSIEVIKLKSDEPEWWESGDINTSSCIASYQAKGVASYAQSLINLANPGTHDAYAGSAPAWATSTGWTFTSDYLRTNILFGTHLIGNTWSIIIRTDNKVSDGSIFGVYTAGSQGRIHSGWLGNMTYGNGNAGTQGPAADQGVYCVAGLDGYRDGVDEVNITSGATPATREIYIACENTGSPASYCNIDILALAVYNVILTPAQVLALTTAMNAL